MGKENRSYTEEFKQEAVNLAVRSGPVSKVAKELGIPVATLHSWVNTRIKAKSSAEGRGQDLTNLFEENRRLHKELAVAKEERDILKKAAAYFAKHQK
jgi:transposase